MCIIRTAVGVPVNAEFEARRIALGAVGVKTTLTYVDLLHAVCGFRSLLSFPGNIFICPPCTPKPKYIVFDGTDIGPSKTSVEHLRELDKPGGDDTLKQGSLFEDRTFLHRYQERELVHHLVTGGLDLEDFLEADMESREGRLIFILVTRIQHDFCELPAPYKRLLTNLAKETSVAGFLQVTQPKPLLLLRQFAEGSLDLKNLANIDQLNLIKSELPPLWSMLQSILDVENVAFLPDDVATIVLRLLKIRDNTFRKAATRSSNDYTEWDEPRDHPTCCYPGFPLRQYPQRYSVRSRADPDRCKKEIREGRNFVEGIMTVGCPCKNNITMGFELMLNPETAHNAFRFLMCR